MLQAERESSREGACWGPCCQDQWKDKGPLNPA